ncbi:MAG TPA: DUF4065 domain-containing protein [Candidatus Fermentibacter daniensis]|nr:DUF4065 domain-containing protein [Candidatus Fermentibacter daniensis]HOG55485.1 DUF4065 domain-containing protein [Candidatus Fermentibacter daniensis]HQM41858.1 DUF4065 domain-containing protein [Candidatus Fermentibacter daniensis]
MHNRGRSLCPVCEKMTEGGKVRRTVSVAVRGETIEVEEELIECEGCGASYATLDSPDAVALANRIYRERHGYLSPDDIRSFRNRYRLTQKELAGLLGWGVVTLSRYENGALQEAGHEKALRMAMKSSNLADLVKSHAPTLQPGRAEAILKLISESDPQSGPEDLFRNLTHRPPDGFNGYRSFEPRKLFGAVEFLCRSSEIYRTALNKLLFYVDFIHFRDHGCSITGSVYVRLPFGPVPDRFNSLFAVMVDTEKLLVSEERILPEGATGEVFKTRLAPDIALLSDTELEVLIWVKRHLACLSASQLKTMSHDEDAWKKTPHAKPIPYSFAADLRGVVPD